MSVGLLGLVALVALIIAGVPLVWSIGLVAVLGNVVVFGISGTGLNLTGIQLFQSAFESLTNFIMISIPLYIFMGQMVAGGGLGRDVFGAVYKWTGWLPGGLAVTTTVSCAGFGAVTGVSAAGIGTLAPIAMPEMRRYGYTDALAAGSLASASTLAILIPPSLSFVIYGILTEQSIGKLFLAGVVPGLLMTGFFVVYIIFRAMLRPEEAPRAKAHDRDGRWTALLRVTPVVVIFLFLMSGLYRGWFTPSEGAAVGCLAVAVVLAFMGRFSVTLLVDAAISAARISIMIFAIVVVVQLFSRFLVLTNIQGSLVAVMSDPALNRYVVLAMILFVFVLLGMVLDTIGMMLLTLPFVYPIIVKLGFDPIWFGVIMTIMVEVGLLTPPVGMNCYMLKQIDPALRLADIFRGVAPFVLICLLSVLLFTLVPEIVLALPKAAF